MLKTIVRRICIAGFTVALVLAVALFYLHQWEEVDLVVENLSDFPIREVIVKEYMSDDTIAFYEEIPPGESRVCYLTPEYDTSVDVLFVDAKGETVTISGPYMTGGLGGVITYRIGLGGETSMIDDTDGWPF